MKPEWQVRSHFKQNMWQAYPHEHERTKSKEVSATQLKAWAVSTANKKPKCLGLPMLGGSAWSTENALLMRTTASLASTTG